MKLCGRLMAGLIAVMVAGSAAFAIGDTGEANPYQAIVARNVFGLKDPPPPPAPPEQPKPAIKLSLQGITDILGRKQVLIKVQVPAKPPEPAKEVSLVLSEGEREEDVEIVSIDRDGGVVKILNGTTPDTLTLKDDASAPTVGVAPVPVSALVPSRQVVSQTATPGLRTIPTRPMRTVPTPPPPVPGNR